MIAKARFSPCALADCTMLLSDGSAALILLVCRVLRAALKLVQADHLCPEIAAFDTNVAAHLSSYHAALLAAPGNGSLRELASILFLYLQLFRSGGVATEELARVGSALQLQLQAMLASPTASAAIRRQLEQLSAEQPEGQLPFIWLQLEGACQAALVHTAQEMIRSHAAWQAGAQPSIAEAARPVLQAAIDAWRRLEPGNLRTAGATAVAALLCGGGVADLPPLRRALQLAQQQRSPYWVVRCASAAAMAAAAVPCEAATLRAVVEDFSQAEPALRSCSRLLPQPWVTVLSLTHQGAIFTLSLLRSRLAALESGAARSPMDALVSTASRQQVERFMAASVQQAQALDSGGKCAGCGKVAVGLRACARCRSVRYCSRACQENAWPQHKRECRPA